MTDAITIEWLQRNMIHHTADDGTQLWVLGNLSMSSIWITREGDRFMVENIMSAFRKEKEEIRNVGDLVEFLFHSGMRNGEKRGRKTALQPIQKMLMGLLEEEL